MILLPGIIEVVLLVALEVERFKNYHNMNNLCVQKIFTFYQYNQTEICRNIIDII